MPNNKTVKLILQVWGAKEYLTPGSSLSEYDYIRECVRLEKDVRLVLCEGQDTSMARTERDDARDAHLTLDDLIPSQGATPMLSFDNLSILLGKLGFEILQEFGINFSIILALEDICLSYKKKGLTKRWNHLGVVYLNKRCMYIYIHSF